MPFATASIRLPLPPPLQGASGAGLHSVFKEFPSEGKTHYLEGHAPTAACGSGRGAGGRRAVAHSGPARGTPLGPAAAGRRGTASGNGAAVEGVTVTYWQCLPVPVAARPWFLAPGDNEGKRVPVTVYGRRPDGSVQPYSVTLYISAYGRWRLHAIVPLANDLDVHRGDRVRLTREEVAAGPGGDVVGAGMGVVVEKVAGQQQGQQQQEWHRRRHARTAVHIGMQQGYAEPFTVPWLRY